MSALLDHSPAKIIKQLLIGLSLGTEPISDDEWPIYKNNVPDGDDVEDNAIGVIDTAGLISERIQFNGRHVEKHGIQILVRAESESIGSAKSSAIARALDEVYRLTVTIGLDVYVVHDINRTSDVIRLGPETETDRRRFSINCLSQIKQSPQV